MNLNKFGIYGYLMGGKLMVLVVFDFCVKVVVLFCGGISDNSNENVLY